MSENSETGQDFGMSGDVQRAAAIFFEHGDFIRTVIRYKIKDESAVEDLFQNFFLSLASRPIPPDVQDIKGYIYTAITNDITDHIRHLIRFHTMKNKFADFSKIIVNNSLPEDALIEKEQTDLMLKLIKNRVTKNEFRAIESRCGDGLSFEETADKMDINARSVVRYISTGLRKVKKYLEVKHEVENDSTQF